MQTRVEARTHAKLAPAVARELMREKNEVYLWHGSSPSGVLGIKHTGFRRALAGTAHGTMLGSGIYFAECSSKSDEYATADTTGVHAGCCALLLCRVCLGEPYVTEQPEPLALRAAMSSGKYDSVLCDREKAVGTYREFVVYEDSQAYPEYIVIYKRVRPASDDA